MRIVLITLHKGAEMKTHTAPGIITVQVLEGDITCTTEQKWRIAVCRGSVLVYTFAG